MRKQVEERTVREVMTPTPVAVRPSTTVGELKAVEPGDPVVVAVDLMVETKLRTLPVVERRGGKPVLVGIVSRKDLLRCLTIEEDRGHA